MGKKINFTIEEDLLPQPWYKFWKKEYATKIIVDGEELSRYNICDYNLIINDELILDTRSWHDTMPNFQSMQTLFMQEIYLTNVYYNYIQKLNIYAFRAILKRKVYYMDYGKKKLYKEESKGVQLTQQMAKALTIEKCNVSD